MTDQCEALTQKGLQCRNHSQVSAQCLPYCTQHCLYWMNELAIQLRNAALPKSAATSLAESALGAATSVQPVKQARFFFNFGMNVVAVIYIIPYWNKDKKDVNYRLILSLQFPSGFAANAPKLSSSAMSSIGQGGNVDEFRQQVVPFLDKLVPFGQTRDAFHSFLQGLPGAFWSGPMPVGDGGKSQSYQVSVWITKDIVTFQPPEYKAQSAAQIIGEAAHCSIGKPSQLSYAWDFCPGEIGRGARSYHETEIMVECACFAAMLVGTLIYAVYQDNHTSKSWGKAQTILINLLCAIWKQYGPLMTNVETDGGYVTQ